MALPYLIIKGFRKISISTTDAKRHEELKELENSLSHLLAEIQEASEKALTDAKSIIDKLDTVIKKAEEKIEILESVEKETGKQTKENKLEFKPTIIREIRAPKHLKVQHLSSQGMDNEEIAQKLEMGLGEVELILNLSNTKKVELI